VLPLYGDLWYTFRFADDRIIPRFHLEGIEVGRQVAMFRLDPQTGERLGLRATGIVGDGGWVDLAEPIKVPGGEAENGVMIGGHFFFTTVFTPSGTRLGQTTKIKQGFRGLHHHSWHNPRRWYQASQPRPVGGWPHPSHSLQFLPGNRHRQAVGG